MITIRSKSSIVVLIIIGVASVVFTTPASAKSSMATRVVFSHHDHCFQMSVEDATHKQYCTDTIQSL